MNPPHEQIAVAAYYLWQNAQNNNEYYASGTELFFWLWAEQQLRDTGWEQPG